CVLCVCVCKVSITGNPCILLGTLSTKTTGESAPGKFLEGPGYSSGADSTESYGPPMDYESWHKEDQYPGPHSTGSYYLYWDYRQSYGDFKQTEGYTGVSLQSEYTNISFRSDSEVHQVENLAMEVEEILHRDSPSEMDTTSAESESEGPSGAQVICIFPVKNYHGETHVPRKMLQISSQGCYGDLSVHHISALIAFPQITLLPTLCSMENKEHVNSTSPLAPSVPPPSQNAQPPGSEASSPDWAHLLAVQMSALDQQKQEKGEFCSMVRSLGQCVHHLAASPEQWVTTPSVLKGQKD
ncbi:hypothetical protein P4O66_008232, partial [Electrophorus voltai]